MKMRWMTICLKEKKDINGTMILKAQITQPTHAILHPSGRRWDLRAAPRVGVCRSREPPVVRTF